jgi:hypothetical protein
VWKSNVKPQFYEVKNLENLLDNRGKGGNNKNVLWKTLRNNITKKGLDF